MLRPTTNKVKHAIFDILYAIEGDYTHWLEIFAGTGAVALHAIERGFQQALIVEQESKHILPSIYKNTNISVLIGDLWQTKTLKALTRKDLSLYQILFLDPPYDIDYSRLFRVIIISLLPHISMSCMIILECRTSSYSEIKSLIPVYMLSIIRLKTYGDTSLVFLQRNL